MQNIPNIRVIINVIHILLFDTHQVFYNNMKPLSIPMDVKEWCL